MACFPSWRTLCHHALGVALGLLLLPAQAQIRVSINPGDQIEADRVGIFNAWKGALDAGLRKAGASAQAMSDAQDGRSDDPKTAAALRFALAVVERRGQVEASEVDALRAAGFDDGEIVELLAHVALNLFTNYVNIAFDVPVDFPAVKLRQAA